MHGLQGLSPWHSEPMTTGHGNEVAEPVPSEGTAGVRREGISKARAGCNPGMAQALMIFSAAQSLPPRDPLVLNVADPCWVWGCQGMRGTAQSEAGVAQPGTEPVPQTLQHQTVTKGCSYYSAPITSTRLALPGPSWSLSLTSLGIRLQFQAGCQPRSTYQPVMFPSQLAFPPGCQQT